MADIGYTKVGWKSTSYVNPTNMNQMDNGIKSACDGVDKINTRIVVPPFSNDIIDWHEAIINMHQNLANYQSVHTNIWYKTSASATTNSAFFCTGVKFTETNGRYIIFFADNVRFIRFTDTDKFDNYPITMGTPTHYPT